MAKIQHAGRASDKPKRLAVAALLGNRDWNLTTIPDCVCKATDLLGFRPVRNVARLQSR
jgi:hypothetical protein